ncbi:MAG TPA: hypothetical protein VFG07_00010 [Thermoplasmata archaeon]|nr:hypothetical protein [Thermoplasmata archaeon]
MVVNPLWIGGSLGVLLSGAFVYWQVGRYAAPQIPRSLFDEKKEVYAYTVGLFGGIVLSVPFGLFLTSLTTGPILWSIIGLAGLVVGFELGQWLLLRSRYFGQGDSGPFYAVGFRAGVSAILILTLTSLYLGGGAVDPVGVAALLLESGAIVSLCVTGALLSLGTPSRANRRQGGRGSSLLVGAVGFFFLGFAQVFGSVLAALAAALILLMTARVYARLQGPLLGSIPPPGEVTRAEAPSPTPFGRTDR